MEKKIRLLHIQQTIGSGGVERRRFSLAKKLNKKKFELKIICTQTIGPLATKIRDEGVEVISIGELKHPFHWKRHQQVQRIIKDYQPHIIHGAVFEGVTLAAINGFLMRVPKIIIEETSDPTIRSWRANLLMNLFGRISDCSIGVSPAAVNYLIRKAKISKAKVNLINNGVSLPRKITKIEKNKLKTKLGIKDDEIIIGSVGRMVLDEHKRFSDLIRAFNLLSQTIPKIKLLLLGEGLEKKRYQQLVKELDIQDKVIFVGYQYDTDLYYSIMDIFSLVSAYESFGLVLVEAMLHHLPIVATNVGGMKYIVNNNETGYLIDKYSVDQIKSSISELIFDKEKRLMMGNAGHKKALAHYTESIYVKNIENLYDKLLVN